MFTIATVPYVLPGNLFPKTSQNCFFSGFLGLGVDGNKQVGSALDLVAGVSQVSFHSDDPK